MCKRARVLTVLITTLMEIGKARPPGLEMQVHMHVWTGKTCFLPKWEVFHFKFHFLQT